MNTKKVDAEDLGRVTSRSSSNQSRNMRKHWKPNEILNLLLLLLLHQNRIPKAKRHILY